MHLALGLFNLFCVGLMIDLYRRNKGWKALTILLGVLNLAGAYVNLFLM